MAYRFGAFADQGGALFRVWSGAAQIELHIADHPRSPIALTACSGRPCLYETFVSGAGPGTRYGYRIDGAGPFPDPASRYQPDGVRGLSEVVDNTYDWQHDSIPLAPFPETVFYELHVGTFTPEGTFRSAAAKLDYLRELGVTAIELMPIGDFPGRWNWGYDGVSLFAPSRAYGRPEDLRFLVDEAHARGIAVYLDVVYNHLGPDGAYHRLFHTGFYSSKHQTPWGDALNFAGPTADNARGFFIENGQYWVHDFHLDGFRLDATHAIVDEGDPHFLADFTQAVQATGQSLGRRIEVIAEDSRNWNRIIQPCDAGGFGLTAVWADDLHHQIRVAIAGDRHGYYSDYEGAPADIAQTMRRGWFYEGQHSRYRGGPRGTPSTGIPLWRFITCIQNHDQIGNRARGERLHHQCAPERYRAAVALLLLAPETPLLFMGQEWAASSPFQYFTDHNDDLGRMVTAGRLREFLHFPEFSDPDARRSIPDPQAESTFRASTLRWAELDQPGHRRVYDWHRRLLEVRRSAPREDCRIRESGGLIEIALAHGLTALITLAAGTFRVPPGDLLLTSEDSQFADGAAPITLDASTGAIAFTRAGCAIFSIEGGRS